MRPISYHPLNPTSLSEAKLLCLKAKCPVKIVLTEDFSKFLDNIQSLGGEVFVRVPYGPWSKRSFQYDESNLSEDMSQPRIFLFNNYQIAGTEGLDGGERSRSVNIDYQEDSQFTILEEALDAFWPDMNHQERKELLRVCCSKVQWFVNEYYGDTATYVSEQADLEKLYAILKYHNKLTPTSAKQLGFEDILKNQSPVFGTNGELSAMVDSASPAKNPHFF